MLQLSYGAEWNCKSIWQPAGRMADHPSGYLFAEGCDRFLLVPVDADYPFQSCASEQIADTLAGRGQLKFATTECANSCSKRVAKNSNAVITAAVHTGDVTLIV